LENILSAIAALLLVALNGFFVAAEFSLVKLRQTRVQQISRKHGLRGRLLVHVHEKLDAYLSACQLGITLASLGLGWLGEPAFGALLEPLFHALGIGSPDLVKGLTIALAFLIISFLHIVAGELAPKSLAIRMPEQAGLWTAAPLYCFYWLMYPAIWLLNVSANAMLRAAGLDPEHGGETRYSREELKLIVRSSRPAEIVSANEWDMLSHALDFGQLTVSDLMLPLREAACFSVARGLGENLQMARERRFSRYPVLDRDGETVLGMVDLKDILFTMREGSADPSIAPLIRPVQFVAPEMKASALFDRFREGAPHFAIVGKPGFRAIGFLTLANMLGALVGQIRDDFRLGEGDWRRTPDGFLVGRGSLPIVTLEHVLGVSLGPQTAESVGGMIMNTLGALPRQGQVVPFELFDIVVTKMIGPRIGTVEVRPRPENGSAPK
jgi:CBS domain containing-hemolysin-like protein